jgi:hypothetical protein
MVVAFQLAAPHDETRLGSQAVSSGGSSSVGGAPPPGPYASGRQSGSNLTGLNAVKAPNRPLAGATP